MFKITCVALICLQPGAISSDGDTFAAQGARFRVWGVDSPERGQPGHREAGAALGAMIADQQLACEPRGASYDRIVVRCERPDGVDIGCDMIAAGHAVEDVRYSRGAYAGCRP